MELGFFSERRDGAFCIHAVTGPDEYTTVVDDNAYTNLLAKENLEVATRIVEWLAAADPRAHAALARATGLTADEVEGWRRAAERMYIPRDEQLGVVLQDERFLERKRWDFEGTPKEKHPPYRLLEGAGLMIEHDGEPVRLRPGVPVLMPAKAEPEALPTAA